jgi:hypothetical protein
MARTLKQDLISQREYARRLGISHTAVQQAIASGRISTLGGKIDPAMADHQWQQNTDQSKPRNRITGSPRHHRRPNEPPLPMRMGSTMDAEDDPAAVAGFARARAARELYQAQLAKIELDLRRGILVRADEVRLRSFSRARKARDLLIAVPERLAAILAATEDPGDVRRILDAEMESICQGIIDTEQA